MAVREMEKDKMCTLQRGNSLGAEGTAGGNHRAAKALTQGLFVSDLRPYEADPEEAAGPAPGTCNVCTGDGETE
ncbi:hypothetical protein ABBQ32_013559 [Trebouxia sp. C0010 RCD-2024]